jgi:hypothetical protein
LTLITGHSGGWEDAAGQQAGLKESSRMGAVGKDGGFCALSTEGTQVHISQSPCETTYVTPGEGGQEGSVVHASWTLTGIRGQTEWRDIS